MSNEALWKVILPQKWSQGHTYKGEAEPGAIVKVELKNRHVWGIVICPGEEIAVPKEILKTLSSSLTQPFLLFLTKASEYNMFTVGEALAMVLREPSDTQPWYMFENSPSSIAYVLNKIGKRKFISMLNKGELSSSQLQINFNPPPLTNKQQECLRNSDLSKPLLLWGATGSGKTNVYFSLLSRFIDKQCLILLPEVALTEEFVRKVHQSFGFWPHIWHHKIKSEAKDAITSWALSGQPGIVVGSRSALWIPFSNLGCIVVDEEHDDAFKQDTAPRYDGRNMAVLRAAIENCAVILVSATPSPETWRNVQRGKYNFVQLASEAHRSAVIVRRKFNEWLTVEARHAIISTLKAGGQVLLFLNRRGFASNLFCASCQNVLLCKYCSASMIIYKNLSTKCSYCGYSAAVESCKSCNAHDWRMYGMGVEKVHEELLKAFPDASISILSSDTEDIGAQIQNIHANKIQIAVATQILSKGHHFDNLKLVVILQGDAVTSIDPRYTEKVYQLLTQVMGRFGQDRSGSLAMIQSVNPQNKLIQAIAKGDFRNWIEAELAYRQEHQLPPFCDLIRITVGSKKFTDSHADANLLYDRISSVPNIQVYRPAATPLYQYKGIIRHSILIRYGNGNYPQPALFAIISKEKLPGKSKITIDVAPRSFF